MGEYLSYRAAAGARFSTLRVITAAIAHQHTGLELPNPCRDPIVESVLAESERRAPPVAPRSLPLDLRGVPRDPGDRAAAQAGTGWME